MVCKSEFYASKSVRERHKAWHTQIEFAEEKSERERYRAQRESVAVTP
jgi:hypothetical protein